MPVVNHTKREINAKLVYAGPRGAGIRTSAALVHSRLRPECRSEVKTIGSGAETLQFYDFLPREIGNVDGYHVRFHVYAVAADGRDADSLRMVLKGADGIMFVADASPGRDGANCLALQQLEEALASRGLARGELPLVVQLNKKDLRPASDSAEDAAAPFAGKGWEVVETDARQGDGVLAAVSLLVKKVMREIRRSGVQVQETELLPEEMGETDEPDELETVTNVEGSFPAAAGEKGAWRVSLAGQGTVERDGVVALPLVLNHPDGRRCRMTLTVALTAEEE